MTCHDGFTLNDLASFNHNHNGANRAGSRDGSDQTLSWNCGIEGPTEDAAIEGLRRCQIRNFLFMLLISVGTPMLLMGDEMRRPQRGNNNPYCQDNEVSWLDWSLLARNRDLHRFVQKLIADRLRALGAVDQEEFALSLNELLRHAEIEWHGVRLGSPNWADDSHSIAFTVRSTPRDLPFWLHVMFNAYWEALEFDLPPAPTGTMTGWQRWIDTSLDSPEDINDPPSAPPVPGTQYRMAPRSVAALIVRTDCRSAPAIELKRKPA